VTTDTCYYCGGDRRRASHASWCQPAPLSIMLNTHDEVIDDAIARVERIMRKGLGSVTLEDVTAAPTLQRTWDRAPRVHVDHDPGDEDVPTWRETSPRVFVHYLAADYADLI
jgi:hypothetical protein